LNIDALIARINELAKKAKTEGLTEAEAKERDKLRKEFLAQYRLGMQQVLDNTYVVDEKGNKKKLEQKRPN